MTAMVIEFPGITFLPEGQHLDPNLSKQFSGDDIRALLEKLELFVGSEVLALLVRHNPGIIQELDNKEFAEFVGQTSAFFLRRATDRITIPRIRERLLSELLSKI